MDLPSSVCSGVPLVVVAGPLRWRLTLGLVPGDGALGEEMDVTRSGFVGEGGSLALPMCGVPLSCTTGVLRLRGTACVMGRVRGCGKGSLLDPDGLGAGREGLLIGVLRAALEALGPVGLLGVVAGMGSPVEVVLSLMMW